MYGEKIPGRGNSLCKGPEVGAWQLCLKNTARTSIARVEAIWGRAVNCFFWWWTKNLCVTTGVLWPSILTTLCTTLHSTFLASCTEVCRGWRLGGAFREGGREPLDFHCCPLQREERQGSQGEGRSCGGQENLSPLTALVLTSSHLAASPAAAMRAPAQLYLFFIGAKREALYNS